MGDKKIHRKRSLTVYFVWSAILAALSYAIQTRSFASLGHSLEGFAIVLVALVAVYILLYLTLKIVAVGALGFLALFFHWVLAWIGTGLAMYAAAELFHAYPPSLALSAAISGPLIIASFSDKFVVVALWIAFTYVIFALQHHTGVLYDGEDNGFKAASKKVMKIVTPDKEKAPAKEPKGKYFMHLSNPIKPYLIKEKDLPKRMAFGIATVAPGWNKTKVDHYFGMPREGHMILYGEPGSGKTNMIIGSLLYLDGTFPVKAVITSTKTQDYLPVVAYLRSCGFRVRIIDLTGRTAGTDEFGDQARWSPIPMCTTTDETRKLAEMTVTAAKGSDHTNDAFWAIMVSILFTCGFRAANLTGEDLEWAYKRIANWSDPNDTEVDYTLRTGDKELYDSWVRMRKFFLAVKKAQETGGALPTPATLEEEKFITWVEKDGFNGAAGTGMSIDATLQGFLSRLSTESTYAATRDPNFEIDEWLKSDRNEIFFLVGDMKNIYTTRSIFAVLLNKLMFGADDYAKTLRGERLPFSLRFYLDEMANLSPVPQIANIFSTTRSIGLQIVAIFQSRPQIDKMLDKDEADILVGSSTVSLILPGIKDTNFIDELTRLGGNKVIELTEGNPQLVPLIDGPYILGMKSMDFEDGEPGQGLAQTKGGFTELKLPHWAITKDLRDRGVVPENFREETEALRLKLRTPADKRAELWKKAMAAVFKKDTPVHKSTGSPATSTDSGSKIVDVKSEVVFARPVHKVTTPTAATTSPAPSLSDDEVPCGTFFEDSVSGGTAICGYDGALCDDCKIQLVTPAGYYGAPVEIHAESPMAPQPQNGRVAAGTSVGGSNVVTSSAPESPGLARPAVNPTPVSGPVARPLTPRPQAAAAPTTREADYKFTHPETWKNKDRPITSKQTYRIEQLGLGAEVDLKTMTRSEASALITAHEGNGASIPAVVPTTPKTRVRREKPAGPKALPPDSETSCGQEWVDQFDDTMHLCVPENKCPTCRKSRAAR